MKMHRILALCLTTLLITGTAFAFDKNAKASFDYGEYEKTIETLEKKKDYKKDLSNVMLAAYSNLQLFEFTKAKHYKNEFKLGYDLIVAKAGVDNLNDVLFFVNSEDKPVVVKNARKLVKTIFKNLYKIEDIPKLLPFAQASDKEVKKYAFDTISKMMKPKRDMVNKGGTMRKKDISFFTNKKLITVLLDNIAESKARKILEIIEEPVLQYLGEVGGTESIKLEAAINKSIQKRQKKFPNSNWYSATGKKM